MRAAHNLAAVLGTFILLPACGDDSDMADASLRDASTDAGPDATGVDGGADTSSDTSADVSTDDASVDAPGELPSCLVLTSSFNAGLGTSDVASTDDGRWEVAYGDGAFSEVIPSSGLDFPSDNVLRWGAVDVGGAQNLTNSSGGWDFGVPDVGESVSLRWYYRLAEMDNLGSGGEHPMYFGNVEDFGGYPGPMSVNIEKQGDGTFSVTWISSGTHSGGGGPFVEERSDALLLNTDQTYRWEIRLTRTGDTTFAFEVQIYTTGGELVYDQDDWSCNGTPMGSVTWTVQSDEFDDCRGWINGWEGMEGRSGPFEVYSYESCFAACAGVDARFPIGPYQASEATWTP